MVDLIFDICFLLLAVGATAFVVVRRTCFDLWMSLPVCIAWVLKGARHLGYDWLVFGLDGRNGMEAFLFIRKAHLILGGVDRLIGLLPLGALVRFGMLVWYSRRYRKMQESLQS